MSNQERNAQKKEAATYDAQRQEYGWFGPEIIFGLMYEFIKPGDALLDIGTGTGLSAALFHQAGLQVYGMDIADEMLKVCATKGVTIDLKQHDLCHTPWPYPANLFAHAVMTGVTSFIHNLQPVFDEVTRIIRTGGIFAFTIEEQKQGRSEEYTIVNEQVVDSPGEAAVMRIYRHSHHDVAESLVKRGWVLLRETEFLASKYSHGGAQIFLKAYVARKG
ncbi:MAG: methyltransferase domain-containing protein [Anaerolineae bacterium]|nr:methyltransferase domain-containing protein [Anaerolineae bacterium]